MSVVVLILDHTAGDTAFWEAMLGNRALDVSARCTILKALTYIAEMTGRPLRLTALTADEMEGLVEPRLMHDMIVHLADGENVDDVLDVLDRLPAHEQVEYWQQAE